jgi:hypothetical protein
MTDSTYHLYRNVGAPFTAYRPRTKLWFDTTRYSVADALGGRDAEHVTDGPVPPVLDYIYARHNRDDRPDGQLAPSLSVGDVIVLDFGTGRDRFFSVDSFGFTEVEGPQLTDVYNAGFGNLGPLYGRSTWSEAIKPYHDGRKAERAAYYAANPV